MGIAAFAFEQRIVPEQELQFEDRSFHVILRIALIDKEQIRIFEGEKLPLQKLDQRLESAGSDADMMVAAVVAGQLRQMHMHGTAAFHVAFQAMHVVQKQAFLTGRLIGFVFRA